MELSGIENGGRGLGSAVAVETWGNYAKMHSSSPEHTCSEAEVWVTFIAAQLNINLVEERGKRLDEVETASLIIPHHFHASFQFVFLGSRFVVTHV